VATSPQYAPQTTQRREPVAIPISSGSLWLTSTVLLSLLIYYVVGIDEGALSLLGNHMFVHELVHDSRHLLGFPCH
jgi:Probable cobalt transporter subunit (CbtB)